MGHPNPIKITDETEARILGKADSNIYLEAIHKASERFGQGTAAYRTITRGIDAKNAIGSQYFCGSLFEFLPAGRSTNHLIGRDGEN